MSGSGRISAGLGALCRRAAATVIAGAALLASDAADAAKGRWQSFELYPGSFVEGRLITAVDATGSLETIPAALQLHMDEGWKTYWRSPGDAGLPPQLDWSGSANLAGATIQWPAPERHVMLGVETFGYEDEVIFPLTIALAETGEPVALAARVDILVCSDLCVPATLDVSLDLPAGEAVPDARRANLIDRAVARVPGDGAAAGLEIDRVSVSGSGDAATLVVEATSAFPFEAPDFFVEAGDGFAFGAPTFTFASARESLTAEIPLLQRPDDTAELARQTVTLTLVDGARAMEATPAITPGIGGGAAAAPGQWTILALALLGGLILNVMPCVLPVLSIKLLSAISHGGRSRRETRLGFLASAAGVIVSFLALAGGAIAVQTAGGAVGWGMQFQQPIFLIFMIALLTLFAANLLGWFEILLPSRVGDAALRAGGGSGMAGSFGTGVFATLLATPCSAPFLGTAIGFALSRGATEIFAVFLALGIGMALPYLAVGAWPRLAAWLPRPGRWMVRLKQVLSLPLLATAVWLLTVLTAQVSGLAAVIVGLLMVAVLLALWMRHRLPDRIRPAGVATALAVTLAAFFVPGQFDRPAGATGPVIEGAWTAFDSGAIDGLVADGRVVFVDVTADWCITCEANKRLVLDRNPVAGLLDGEAVTAMRADWTRPDEAIAAYLASHGRYGIPFNVVYGPGAPDGIVLPELLTNGAVVEALQRAGLDS